MMDILREAYEQGMKDAEEECGRCVFSGWKEQMEKHDAKVRAKALDELVKDVCTYGTLLEKEKCLTTTIANMKQTVADFAERLKEQKK